MAEINPRDRLQPFLLDRLIDDNPGAQKESREKNVLSPQLLRAAILRDLTWLFNTPAPVDREPTGEFAFVPSYDEFPQVVSSILNYGVPDLTGKTDSSLDPEEIERGFLKAIRHFEPRLSRHGLTVELKHDSQSLNVIVLTISGEILANQLLERMFIKTEVDLELGQTTLKEFTRG
jgi:type VI secretion system protein ImpF